MTPLETIKAFCENCEKEIKALNPIYSCPFAKEKKLCPQFQMVEKPLKALEIIKKKNVEIQKIKYCFLKDNDIGLITYNRNLVNAHLLTQEEYDILREVLK